MRDIAAERLLLERFFLCAGVLMFFGLMIAMAGLAFWIVTLYWGQWILLTMFMGLWSFGLGLVLALVAGVSRRGLH